MEKGNRIFIAGHQGLVGSAIRRNLEHKGYENLVLRDHEELDLLDQSAVNEFFKDERIDHVFMAAAKVGGIVANDIYPADFLYENLTIAANVIHASAKHDVKKLLFLGSSCIYPKFAPQPIREESLLTGPLEQTNEGYAIAKIAGLKLCEMYMRQYNKRFISAMPTNLYGPNDNYHPDNSHVIPGMLRRFHEAKQRGAREVVIWGTGTVRREFLHVDDLAEGLYILMDKYDAAQFVNIGTGEDCTILELSKLVAEVVGFKGEVKTDPTRPDGTPRKVLDVSKIKGLGWRPRYSLQEGLSNAYDWAVKNRKFD